MVLGVIVVDKVVVVVAEAVGGSGSGSGMGGAVGGGVIGGVVGRGGARRWISITTAAGLKYVLCQKSQ